MLTFLGDTQDEGRRIADRLSTALAGSLAAEVDDHKRRAFLIETIDDAHRAREPLHTALLAAGFVHRSDGYQKRI
jgi:hypothetical protein